MQHRSARQFLGTSATFIILSLMLGVFSSGNAFAGKPPKDPAPAEIADTH
jgi:hypothetical protein